MLYALWVLSLVAAFTGGYYASRFLSRIRALEEALKTPVVSKEPEKPQSSLIDPLDEIAEARYEQEKLMESLNRK